MWQTFVNLIDVILLVDIWVLRSLNINITFLFCILMFIILTIKMNFQSAKVALKGFIDVAQSDFFIFVLTFLVDDSSIRQEVHNLIFLFMIRL